MGRRGGGDGEAFKIHMRGQISVAGFGQWVGKAVLSHRLKRIPA